MMKLGSKGALCSGHYLTLIAHDLHSDWHPHEMMDSIRFDLHCLQDCLKEVLMAAMYLIFCRAYGSFISTSFLSSLGGRSLSTLSCSLCVPSFLLSPALFLLFCAICAPGGCSNLQRSPFLHCPFIKKRQRLGFLAPSINIFLQDRHSYNKYVGPQ